MSGLKRIILNMPVVYSSSNSSDIDIRINNGPSHMITTLLPFYKQQNMKSSVGTNVTYSSYEYWCIIADAIGCP